MGHAVCSVLCVVTLHLTFDTIVASSLCCLHHPPSPFDCRLFVQESAFLITGVIVLVCGVVFTSRGFRPGSVGYVVLNIVASVAILASTCVFVALLCFEVR